MPEWIDVAGAAEVPDGEGIAVQAGERPIALFRVGDDIFATDLMCTHGQARLCDGFVEGYEIECPLHQGRFDIRDGRALCEPVTEDLRTYPVTLEGSRVKVSVG